MSPEQYRLPQIQKRRNAAPEVLVFTPQGSWPNSFARGPAAGTGVGCQNLNPKAGAVVKTLPTGFSRTRKTLLTPLRRRQCSIPPCGSDPFSSVPSALAPRRL